MFCDVCVWGVCGDVQEHSLPFLKWSPLAKLRALEYVHPHVISKALMLLSNLDFTRQLGKHFFALQFYPVRKYLPVWQHRTGKGPY